jgi:16S rRNA (uracil1498-N3)-methyltransferase
VSAPLFLVGAGSLPERGVVEVGGPEGRHAVRVRRLRVGEAVDLADGAGVVAHGVVTAAADDVLTVDVADVERVPEPAPRLVVAQALPKGDRGELAVELMTEVGVDAIVPWAAARCITQWKGERGLKALGKWRATAREAGKQSRRVRFPEVADAATSKQVAALLAKADFAAVLHESGEEPLATAELPAEGEIVLVVGPEGGVSPEELALFREAGARAYVLGRTVLRTSTAGTAAAALLLGRTGRWS